MPLNLLFGEKLSWPENKLEIIAHISGWIGIILRLTSMGYVCSIIDQSKNDIQVNKALYGLLLTYIIISLFLNGLFIFGIYKKNRHYLLPYVIIVAIEMGFAVMIAWGAVLLLLVLHSFGISFGILAIGILCIGIIYTMWLYNVLLYSELPSKTDNYRHKSSEIGLNSY